MRYSTARPSIRSTPTELRASPSRTRSTPNSSGRTVAVRAEHALLVVVAHAGPTELVLLEASRDSLDECVRLLPTPRGQADHSEPPPRLHAGLDRQVLSDEFSIRLRGGLDRDANRHDPPGSSCADGRRPSRFTTVD